MSFYIGENCVESPLETAPRCEKKDLPALVFFTLSVPGFMTDSMALREAYYSFEQRDTRGGGKSICLNRKWLKSLEIQLFY